MGEQKKPSSLRTRVDRARKSYGKPMKPLPIIIGLVFVIGCGVALYFAFRGEPTPYGDKRKGTKPPPTETPTSEAAVRPPAPRPLPSDPRQAAYRIAGEAKQQAKLAPEAAMRKLEQALDQYPEYTPTLYRAMAMVVEQKIMKSGGSNAPRHLFEEKREHLLNAKAELDAGRKWAYDPIGNSTGNLEMSIERVEAEIRKK